MAKTIFSKSFVILVLLLFPLSSSTKPQEISLKLVAEPAKYEGKCPATISFKGRIIVSSPCRVQYQFIRSDGATSAIKEEIFDTAGWKDVSTSWTLNTDYSGWVLLRVISPQQKESEKAFFKITCKELSKPALRGITSQPTVPIIPSASYDDSNEPDVQDGKDFSKVKILCPKGEDSIGVEVNFYANPSLSEFFLYFSIDEDSEAEVLIRCLSNKFEIAKETGSGIFTNVIFSGIPAIADNSYSIKFPYSQIFGTLDTVNLWLYAMDGQDRIPDKGQLEYIRSRCTLKLFRSHPVKEATPIKDDDGDGLDDNYEDSLLYKFRPYFLFSKDLVEGRSTEEHYNPTDVLWYLQHSELLAGGTEDSPIILNNDILNKDPMRLIQVYKNDSAYGWSDITKTYKKTYYHINPLAEAHGVGHDPGRHGQPWGEILLRKNLGLYGHVVRANRNYNRGEIQREDGTYDYIKIEYWQFFGYNNANAVQDAGDHEGDWATIQLLYDPAQDKIVKVFHYAHGDEIQFDMTISGIGSTIVNKEWGRYKEFWGPNHNKSFDQAGATAQNNTVRFYLDPQTNEYTHPVVYIEYGTHEFWPTEHGAYRAYWQGIEIGQAPPHKGDDVNHRYLTEAPLNLGEVEGIRFPNIAAEIILKFNGFWGTYNHKNTPPHGPPLHTEWTWPAKSKIRPYLTGQLEN